MLLFGSKKPHLLIFTFLHLLLRVQTANPTTDTKYDYNLLKLKSFWKGLGSAVAYPGKFLLTSDKLKQQRGMLSTHEPTDFGDFFEMTVHVNYHINNKESRQSLLIALTSSSIFPGQFAPGFNIFPLEPQFSGFVIYVKDFDTLHVGSFESSNFNQNELLSRAKLCKISQRGAGFFQFKINYLKGKLTVQIIDNQDGSARPCAQLVGFQFENPLYTTIAGADDFGLAETVICKTSSTW